MKRQNAGPPLGCNGLILAKTLREDLPKRKSPKGLSSGYPRYSKCLNRSLNIRNIEGPGRRRLFRVAVAKTKNDDFPMGRSPEGRKFQGSGFFEGDMDDMDNLGLILCRGWASTGGPIQAHERCELGYAFVEKARYGHRVDTTSA